MTDFLPISSMIIIFDAPALVYRLRRLISRHKSRIVIDIPAYIYIFPKIAHYDSYFETAYFECYSKDSNDIHLLNLLSKRLDILCINNKKQTTLSLVNNSK